MPFCSKPFGAWNSDNADFNACFEDSVMVAFPSCCSADLCGNSSDLPAHTRDKVRGACQCIYKVQSVGHKAVYCRLQSFLSFQRLLCLTLPALKYWPVYWFCLHPLRLRWSFTMSTASFWQASLPLVVYWTVSAVIWIIRIHTRFNQNLTQTLVFMIQLLLNLASIGLEFMTYKVAIEKETDASKA
ncbi:hypothetical protein BDR26DRAFT_851462 [Obelidium mucronatum]|nr:hypothetical protein BDR26DRAFT_851462 [Obelidium mucronatum]